MCTPSSYLFILSVEINRLCHNLQDHKNEKYIKNIQWVKMCLKLCTVILIRKPIILYICFILATVSNNVSVGGDHNIRKHVEAIKKNVLN